MSIIFLDNPTFPEEHQFCWMISRIIPFVVTVRLPLELEICTEHWQNDSARGKQNCSDRKTNQ